MNRKTIWLFIILTLLLQPLHATPPPSLYSFNSDLNEGISQLSVMDIFQDSRGYLWFGTRNGLNRFNGKEYVIYRREDGNEQSLSNNMISSVTEDREMNLWVATNKGLNRIDLHTDKIEQYYAGENGLTDDGITRVYTDRSGRLWVCTWAGLSLYDKANDSFRTVTLGGEISNTAVSAVLEDSAGRFWIATYSEGVYVCDNKLNIISHFTKNSGNMPLSGNTVTVLFEDSRKQIWAGCRHSGLNRINLRKNEIVSFTSRNSGLTDNSVRCLTEWNGLLLIGTFDGIFSFHPETRQIDKVAGYAPADKSLTHYSVYSFHVDRDSTLWVGTYAGGVNYLNKFTNRFVLHNPVERLNRHTGIYGAIACEPPAGLWIATEGHGLLNYDCHTGRAQYYLIAPTERFAYQTNIIKSVFYENGSVWCGTTKGEIYRFDTGKKEFTLYYRFPEEFSIYSLLRDRQGNLWAGGTSAHYPLTCFTGGKQPVTEITGSDGIPLPLPDVRCLLEEADGCFLLGSQTKGLFRLDTRRKRLTQYNNEATKESERIPGNYISALVRTRNNTVWVATYGGGIFELGDTTAVKRRISVHTGLLDDNICSLAEGADGNLWMSTVNGLAMFDPATGEVRNFHRRNGIDIREFTLHSGIALPDGTLCFSGSNGFVTFGVETMKKNTCIPPVVLEDLWVNNRPVRAGDDTAILSRVLDDAETVRLRHDENNFSITYQALNYVYAAQNRYAYKLEGYDPEWNDVGTRNSAFYTNLGPGKYVFRVKAANNDGVWNETGRRLTIIVQPPWWATWYAYLVYAAALAAVTGLFIRAARVKQALRQQIRLKQQEKERQEAFHEAKVRLLTRFSHELRTPLMLIVTPFEELVKHTDLPSDLHEKLTVIHKNARKLLLSVNQLLDLHTDQTDRLELKVSEGDICEYIREIYYAFRQVALANEIGFTLDCRPESFRGWFDKSLFEKVVFNLLSNAFKYTPDGGSIRMEVTETGRDGLPPGTVTGLFGTELEGIRYLVLKVCDSGKGIPREEAGNIFTPFYRISGTDDTKFPGSGIGLSLVQAIVKLHRGIIRLGDSEEKEGCFTVILPVSRSAFPDEQVEPDAYPHSNSLIYNTLPPPPPAKSGATAPSVVSMPEGKDGATGRPAYTVLLAEDDNDVRAYLKKSLETTYRIIDAADGMKAFDCVLQHFPDLVLSDIMMPKRDGLELCRLIKKDLRTGHIPVILMTARSLVVHIKEGFQAGADDYIVKPFHMDVLRARIDSLLASRAQLKKLYGKRFAPDVLGIEVKSADEHFSQKLFDVIEKHISDEKLGVELLCAEIGISRANLYRKLKSITELSPMELIRNKRLETAGQLLRESGMNVSEVALHLGFNSHSYFSNSFKAFYGCTPTEFVQTHKENRAPGL